MGRCKCKDIKKRAQNKKSIHFFILSSANTFTFWRICNSPASSLRICNPILALQMLIFITCELQIRTNKARTNPIHFSHYKCLSANTFQYLSQVDLKGELREDKRTILCEQRYICDHNFQVKRSFSFDLPLFSKEIELVRRIFVSNNEWIFIIF